MKKKSMRFLIIVSVSAMLLGMLAALGIAMGVSQKRIETKGVAKKCLACHSYEKIRKDTAKYKTPNGDVATPHQYVPHKEKEKGDIPDCTECHEAHPTPLKDKSKVVKPKDISYCYSECHHRNNLDSCTKCHPGSE
jgi:hypothetical protein